MENNDKSQDNTLADEVRNELSEIDSLDISEHAERFENLHKKLHEALTTIDGL
jgi:hypothetical protein